MADLATLELDDVETPAAPPARRTRGPAVLAMLVAASLHVFLQIQMLVTQPGFSIWRFKNFFAYDQLSYLAIAINVANGHSGSTEPFTEEGPNHYPRLYYVVMGLLSRWTHTSPVAMWWLMGLALQFVLALFVGWALYSMTKRWWTPLLAPLPFLVGTFAGVLHDDWMTKVTDGPVLWGPFALIYALNGGVAGVTLSSCLVIGLLVAGWHGFPLRMTMVAGIFAAVCVGLLGNMQTYSFIGVCYALVYGIGVYGLLSAPDRTRRRLAITSVVVLVAVLALGPVVADGFGPLVVFGLGMLPALPGYLVVCRLTSWRLLWLSLLAGVLASPTPISTLLGVAHDDPFLVYRQGSTAAQGDLGVPISWLLLNSAVPVLLLLIVILVPTPWSRLTRSYGVGMIMAWTLLSFNDHWGASQEPYRFAIDFFTLVMVTGFPLLVAVGFHVLKDRSARGLVATATGVALVVWSLGAVVSAKDWLEFNKQTREWGLTWWPSQRSDVIKKVVGKMPASGIVAADSCTDLRSLKAITGARVADFGPGLAWPTKHDAFVQILKDHDAGIFDVRVADEAGVQYLLTDTHCRMVRVENGELTRVAGREYVGEDGQTYAVRLWRVTSVTP